MKARAASAAHALSVAALIMSRKATSSPSVARSMTPGGPRQRPVRRRRAGGGGGRVARCATALLGIGEPLWGRFTGDAVWGDARGPGGIGGELDWQITVRPVVDNCPSAPFPPPRAGTRRSCASLFTVEGCTRTPLPSLLCRHRWRQQPTRVVHAFCGARKLTLRAGRGEEGGGGGKGRVLGEPLHEQPAGGSTPPPRPLDLLWRWRWRWHWRWGWRWRRGWRRGRGSRCSLCYCWRREPPLVVCTVCADSMCRQ